MALIKSVKNRTLLLLLAVALLPTLLLVSYYYQQTKHQLIRLSGEELLEKSYLLARDLDRILIQRQSEIKVISQADVFESTNINSIEQYIREIDIESNFISEINIYDLELRLIASSSQFESPGQFVFLWPQKQRELMIQATALKQGQVLFTDAFSLEGEPYLKLITPITDDDNLQVIKILVTSIALDKLIDIVYEFELRIAGLIPVQIIDNTGLVILSKNTTLVGQPFRDLSNNPNLLQDLNLPRQNISRQYVNADNIRVVAGFAKVSEFGANNALDWSIFAATPTATILASMSPVLTSSLLMFVLFVAGTAATAYFVSLSISTPIEKLTKYTLDSTVNVNKIKGAREIELLRDHIVSSKQSLEQLNQSLEQRVEERTSELQKTREQVIEQEKMASLGRMVAGISHEINTPLGLIVTAISHLKEQSVKIKDAFANKSLNSKQLKEYLDTTADSIKIVDNASNRAVDLVQSFKQVAVDQTSEQSRHIQLKDFVDEVITTLGPKLKHKPHQIHVTTSDDNVETDSGALYQIISNLIINSLIHGFDDDKAGNIMLSLTKQKNELILDYKDDGKGVDEQHLPQLFEPFFTTKRGEGGSGLGTHIIYNLATQRLNGSIDVQPITPSGLHFKIVIPLKG